MNTVTKILLTSTILGFAPYEIVFASNDPIQDEVSQTDKKKLINDFFKNLEPDPVNYNQLKRVKKALQEEEFPYTNDFINKLNTIKLIAPNAIKASGLKFDDFLSHLCFIHQYIPNKLEEYLNIIETNHSDAKSYLYTQYFILGPGLSESHYNKVANFWVENIIKFPPIQKYLGKLFQGKNYISNLDEAQKTINLFYNAKDSIPDLTGQKLGGFFQMTETFSPENDLISLYHSFEKYNLLKLNYESNDPGLINEEVFKDYVKFMSDNNLEKLSSRNLFNAFLTHRKNNHPIDVDMFKRFLSPIQDYILNNPYIPQDIFPYECFNFPQSQGRDLNTLFLQKFASELIRYVNYSQFSFFEAPIANEPNSLKNRIKSIISCREFSAIDFRGLPENFISRIFGDLVRNNHLIPDILSFKRLLSTPLLRQVANELVQITDKIPLNKICDLLSKISTCDHDPNAPINLASANKIKLAAQYVAELLGRSDRAYQIVSAIFESNHQELARLRVVDTQNVHSSKRVQNTHSSIEELFKLDDQAPINYQHTLMEVYTLILKLKETLPQDHPFQSTKRLKRKLNDDTIITMTELDAMERALFKYDPNEGFPAIVDNETYMGKDGRRVTSQDIFARVFKIIKAKELKEGETTLSGTGPLTHSFLMSLAQMVDESKGYANYRPGDNRIGHVVCVEGKIQRLLTVLQGEVTGIIIDDLQPLSSNEVRIPELENFNKIKGEVNRMLGFLSTSLSQKLEGYRTQQSLRSEFTRNINTFLKTKETSVHYNQIVRLCEAGKGPILEALLDLLPDEAKEPRAKKKAKVEPS